MANFYMYVGLCFGKAQYRDSNDAVKSASDAIRKEFNGDERILAPQRVCLADASAHLAHLKKARWCLWCDQSLTPS